MAAILGAARRKSSVIALGNFKQAGSSSAQWGSAIFADGAAQEHPAAFLAPFGKSRIAQDPDMARDPGLALSQHLRKFAHRQLHRAEQTHDAQPGLVGQRAKEGIDPHYGSHIKKSLYLSKGG